MGDPLDDGVTATEAASPRAKAAPTATSTATSTDARTDGSTGATTEPTEATPVKKQSLGRYEIESLLGAGGMGVVYAAFDPELERRVALKVLPDARRGQSARERLLREARAMARLNHPNVVRVYEVDTVDGHDFVAMELVDGGDLSDWLRAETRSPEEVIERFLAAGRGLVAAHAAGVVHRDFKPHNVLCASDGRIFVTDFGLAREVDYSSLDDTDKSERPSVPSRASPLTGITETGSVLGTPAYMAPEQREAGVVGPAADQFAFCVALWEGLTGKRPYRGGNVEEMIAALAKGPASLDASVLPRRLRAPLLRGLEPDPAKRWPSMKALLAQIAPPSRRIVPLAVGGAALLSIAIVAIVLSMRGGNSSPCTPPQLDPNTVWPAGYRAKVLASKDRWIAKMFDNDLASWKATRATACKAPPKVREVTLACLDAVLARMSAVVQFSDATGYPDIDPEDLIEPAICARPTPPRLPRVASPEYREVAITTLREVAKGTHDWTPQIFAAIDASAKQEPCARALASFIHAKSVTDAAVTFPALHDAEVFAEQCGDDHALATILVYSATTEIQTKGVAPERIARATAAVARVPTTDLQARLEIMRMFEARSAEKLDDAIAFGESALAKLEARGCYGCVARAGAIVVELRTSRATPADLKGMPALFDRVRAAAVLVEGSDLLTIDALRADFIWREGKLEEAHLLNAAARTVPLEKPMRAKGRVVDGAGSPVAGAAIVAGPIQGDSVRAGYSFWEPGRVRTVTTNEHGEFEVETETEGFVIAQRGELRSAPVLPGVELTLVIEPTSRLSGRVNLGGAPPMSATVYAVDSASRGTKLEYSIMAPVRSDGTFELAGIRRHEVDLRVSVQAQSGGQGASVHVLVERPEIHGLELSVAGPHRTVDLLVRSTVGMAVPAARVGIFEGEAHSTNLRDLMKEKTSIASTVDPRPIDLASVPEAVKKLARRGDLHARFERVPAGPVTVCASGLLEADQIDEELQKKINQQLERIEVRCVAMALDTRVVVIEVPPFPRFD